MSLTLSDIDRIANLARLSLAPDEAPRLMGQLNGFFDIVEQMRAVDTTGIEALAHPVAAVQDITLRQREDIANDDASAAARDFRQRSAPTVERGLFLVPKVIE
jgi:aspartyl-tRNA(Asn)/glutamyl-tRNA(Gln) amidotransferase subunit C